jgi:CRP/FNR family transcriptional regulator, cyclic AMP receptor protein
MRTAPKTFDVDAFLVAVGSKKNFTHYRRKQVIFSQDERSDAIFYIESGSVKLVIVSREGREAIISIMDGGSFVGESCISLGQPVRFHSAVALTDARLVRIDKGAIVRMLQDGGDASVNFASHLFRQVAQREEDLADRLLESSEQSLVRVISALMQFQTGSSQKSRPRISQQTLAEMIGVSRQHVNVLMKRIRDGGVMPLSASTNVSVNAVAAEKSKATPSLRSSETRKAQNRKKINN